jgi:hypothetical protein
MAEICAGPDFLSFDDRAGFRHDLGLWGELLKLLLEISDSHLTRIRSVTGQDELDCVIGFIGHAIEAHLQEIERLAHGRPRNEDLIALSQQVRELREGQRAIAAIVDSSTTLLARFLRGTTYEADSAAAR